MRVLITLSSLLLLVASLLAAIFYAANPSKIPTPVKETFSRVKSSLFPSVQPSNEVVLSSALPENSRYYVSEKSLAYSVSVNQPPCYLQPETRAPCELQNNKKRFTPCHDPVANDWNIIGVKTMERYVSSAGSKSLHKESLLQDAYYYFSNATTLEKSCWSAQVNLALVLMRLRLFTVADVLLDTLERVVPKAEVPTILVYHALVYEFLKKNPQPFASRANREQPNLEKKYAGLLLLPQKERRITVDRYNKRAEQEVMLDYLIFQEFSPRSIANYAMLHPDTQNTFIRHRYIVLRKLLPPFILEATRRYYAESIRTKNIVLEDAEEENDTNARRLIAYNDRGARFIHYHLNDVIQRVVAAEVKPSYTYFAHYIEKSTLVPHTDRPQCEYTLSLNLEHYPARKHWPLALGTRWKFDVDDNWNGQSLEQMPPENETAVARLGFSDGLLFMGRQLIHFRIGALGAGEHTTQIFLHYVRKDFKKTLD